jgi:hypothetical protein
MELAAASIVRGHGHNGRAQWTVSGTVAPDVLEYIRKLARPGRASETPKDPPAIEEELRTLRALNKGHKVSHSVTLDVFVEAEGREYYFDLKTPAPNSDQPRDMKDRLMRVRALRLPEVVDARGVFYYNPQGTEGLYTSGQAYLDYKGGEVLVGRQFWDFLAGDGTYEELIGLFAEVGTNRSDDLIHLLGR